MMETLAAVLVGFCLWSLLAWAVKSWWAVCKDAYRIWAGLIRFFVREFREARKRKDLPVPPPLPALPFPSKSHVEPYRTSICPTCGHAAQREYDRVHH